ncbi:MAG: tetratricopeptide repeat protein [Bacteroidia bacterium]
MPPIKAVLCLFVCILVLFTNSILAQSLIEDIKDVPNDIKVSYIRDFVKGKFKKDSARTKVELRKAYKYFEKDKLTYATLLTAEATFYFKNDRVNKALDMEKQALAMYDSINEIEGALGCLSRISKYHFSTNSQNELLAFLFEKLKSYEGNSDKECLILERIGATFKEMKNDEKAFEYLKQASSKVNHVATNKQMMKSILNINKNLGVLYRNKNDYQMAEYHLSRALALSEEAENEGYSGVVLNSLGILYTLLGENFKAIQAYEKSIEIKLKSENYGGVANSYANLASLYLKTGNLLKAETAVNKSFEYMAYVEDKQREQNIYAVAAFYFEAVNKPAKAYPYLKKAYELKDSAYKSSIAEESAKLEAIFGSEKKQKEIELSNLKNAQLEESIKTKNRERNMFVAGSIILLILLVFAVFSYFGKRKANAILSEKNSLIVKQKTLVEQQHKEIIDSITYAKRLQNAILPSDEMLQKHFEEYFVFYKPKDIVAGDFYWLEEVNDTLFLCVADCTGHGVPGAMISIVCSNALNRSVNEYHITEPGLILDKTRDLVLENLSKSDTSVRDGMDISFLSINKSKGEIKWAGANNPIWYFHKGKLIEIKGDKQPIGKSDISKPFSTHSLNIEKNDIIILFSDGYADQFGGPNGKKFKYKQFQELISSNNKKPLNEIKSSIDNAFNTWKGNLEQVDDICIFAVKI